MGLIHLRLKIMQSHDTHPEGGYVLKAYTQSIGQSIPQKNNFFQVDEGCACRPI